VIEKKRGKSSHHIRRSERLNGINYLIQTNHDSNVDDPDGRSTAAEQKLKKIILGNNKVEN
jgi:hypothetical protein